MKYQLLIAAIAAAGTSTTLGAQDSAPKTDSSCKTIEGRVECRIYRGKGLSDSAWRRSVVYKMDSAMARRAALGLQLRATGTRRDTLGVFVEAVTPKGPAETAGIVEGDRIAAINGVDLRSAAADVDDPYTNGLASHRLTREVQKLTPGSRVTLRVYSGGRFRDVQVVAGKATDLMRLGNRFNFRVPGPGGMMEFGGPGGMMEFGPGASGMMFRTPMPLRFKTMQPSKIRRAPTALRQLAPLRTKVIERDKLPRIRTDAGELLELEGGPTIRLRNGEVFGVEPAEWEFDEDEFPELEDVFEVENDVTSDVIRELGAATVRDAHAALKQLAAEGLV